MPFNKSQPRSNHHHHGGGLFWKNSRKRPPKQAIGSSRHHNVFETTSITMTDNRNADYKPVGIVHATGIYAVGVAKSLLSGTTNSLGFTAFESGRYSSARRRALNKLHSELQGTDKICNLRMEVHETRSTVIAHAYGTLYSTKSNMASLRHSANNTKKQRSSSNKHHKRSQNLER